MYRSPSRFAVLQSERIGFDDAQVFGDRQVDLALANELLGVAQYGSPFDWHV